MTLSSEQLFTESNIIRIQEVQIECSTNTLIFTQVYIEKRIFRSEWKNTNIDTKRNMLAQFFQDIQADSELQNQIVTHSSLL